MYGGAAPAHSCEQEPDHAVRELAAALRSDSEAVEAVRERLRGAQEISWDSPAGRNFRAYLRERSAAIAATAHYLREVACALDAYAVALATAQAEGVNR